ncbi:bifunctional 5,10-methylenetetrahydrofolate dehydrogenase/5,10-methenyltetrahydrofolate cyclohydrolase [Terriglobus aquaticus]|uniref:Bifunctional protein FolD n=1 Tax=Terriglobus aquaticus TaxID=940139 RepID=A0ABW9KGH7_9BACT|nr:bifunctional 5,10-methylenetetrahydrofolate dehydrogenase/5,10-methenyltetrahydrofolate cyclohydrolase [Terriglobus aquaticus]
MSARVLDGVAIAAEIKEEVGREVRSLAEAGAVPGLTVVLVGSDPASEIYVRSKVKSSAELGIASNLITLGVDTSQAELLGILQQLNEDDAVDGILVQLPLPRHIDTRAILEAVDPLKDVDGFHPVNVGRLTIGQESLVPCTPAGVMQVLQRSGIAVRGRDCVMVGRSDIVGKPMSTLLLNAGATVAVCHKETRDLREYTRRAEILVVATGVPGLITPDMVAEGAVLIDVGINRLDRREDVERLFPGNAAKLAAFDKRGSVLVGDFAPQSYLRSSAYTPVPGGVGALTIAMLMHNTVKAARMRRSLPTDVLEFA